MNDKGKILAFVLAGGEGSRLRPLTANCAKPAVRFAGEYRIVDFVLGNLVNSGVEPIYVLAQYKPDLLLRHVSLTWGNRRVHSRLPRTGSGFEGTADAVHRNLDLVEQHRPDMVAVFAADHVYRMDVRQMAHFHASRDADITVSAIPVPLNRASAFGIMAVADDGTIEEFREKPDVAFPLRGNPNHAYASMGNYLFRPACLRALLAQALERGGTDFGRDILPRLPGSAYRALAYDFEGNEVPGVRDYEERAYWRDVGTLDALAEARQDIVGVRPRLDLSNNAWPIRRDLAPHTSVSRISRGGNNILVRA